jgi:glycerol-3-phosphate acyltransferase PlsY
MLAAVYGLMIRSSISVLFGLPVLAYFLGSIPWGLLLTRWFTSIDIRQQGSGNIGATNVSRLAGMPLGLLTLVGDIMKGVLPVYLAVQVTGLDPTPYQVFVSITAIAAFSGHLFPLYLKLQGGGKGVAIAFGCFIVISPFATALSLVTFAFVVWISRRVSAGSLASAIVLAPAVWWFEQSLVYCICALLIVLLIFVRHRENIRRLINGSEPKFGLPSNNN